MCRARRRRTAPGCLKPRSQENASATEAFAELRRDWTAAIPSERPALEPRIRELHKQFNGDPVARYADLYLAWIALEQGHIETARELSKSVQLGPRGNAKDLGTLVEGAVLSRQGRASEALELLMPLLGKLFDPFARELLHDEATRAGLAAQRWSDLIDVVLERRLRDTVEEDESVVRRSVEDAVAQIPPLVLERAFQQMQRDLEDGVERHSPQLRKLVTRRLATIALERGDTALARRLLAGGDTLGTLGASGASVVQLAGIAEEPDMVAGRTLGLILSSGSPTLRARAAEVSLGVVSALGPSGRAVRLVAREANTPDGVRAALQSLVRAGASIVIGGLEGEPAQALAANAEITGIPVILLSSPDHLPETPHWTFQGTPESGDADVALLAALGPRCSMVQIIGPPTLAKTPQALPVQDCPSSPLGAPGALSDRWKKSSFDALLVTGDRVCAQQVSHAAITVPRATLVLGVEGASLLLPAAKGLAPVSTPLRRGTLYASLGRWPTDANGQAAPEVISLIETQRAVVTWWTVLGLDTATLAATALSTLDTTSTTDATEIAKRRGMARDALVGSAPSPVLGIELRIGHAPKSQDWSAREVR